MIYIKGAVEAGAVKVLGGDLEKGEIHLQLPNGKLSKLEILKLTTDGGGIKEIINTIKEAQAGHTELWELWKKTCQLAMDEDENSIFHELNIKAIETKHDNIPGFCWIEAGNQLEKLLVEKFRNAHKPK